MTKEVLVEDTNNQCNCVAVYGTLKDGYHANRKLTSVPGCTFVGRGTTVGRFLMSDCGYPMLHDIKRDTAHPELFGGDFDIPADAGRVAVEVYENPDMKVLDWYEGYPSLYTRRVVVVALEDGSTVNAWIYVGGDVHEYGRAPAIVPNDGVLSWPADEDTGLLYAQR